MTAILAPDENIELVIAALQALCICSSLTAKAALAASNGQLNQGKKASVK